MNLAKTAVTTVIGGHRRPTFFKVLPTFGMIHVAFHVAAQRLIMPVNAHVAAMTVVIEKEIGEARNMAMKTMLEMPKGKRPEFLFFFGDDMIPPCDALVNLYEIMYRETWDILAGMYYIKQDIYPVPILWRNGISGYLREGIHYNLGDVVDTDICGMDFTLIRPEIFEKIDPPWFLSGHFVDNDGGILIHTEDAYCVKKVKEAGGRVGVATGVRVGHLDVTTGEIY